MKYGLECGDVQVEKIWWASTKENFEESAIGGWVDAEGGGLLSLDTSLGKFWRYYFAKSGEFFKRAMFKEQM